MMLCVNSRTCGTVYQAPATNASRSKIAMYQPLLELFPTSNCGATVESGTESGSMLLVDFASGSALGSTGAGATATAAAVAAALAFAAAADFDGDGLGGSAMAIAAGATAAAVFVATGVGGGATAAVAVGTAAAGATVASSASFGFNRFEISVIVQRDLASRRNVLRAMSRYGCGTLSGKPGSPAVSSGRRWVSDSTIVTPSDHASPDVVARPFVSGAT